LVGPNGGKCFRASACFGTSISRSYLFLFEKEWLKITPDPPLIMFLALAAIEQHVLHEAIFMLMDFVYPETGDMENDYLHF